MWKLFQRLLRHLLGRPTSCAVLVLPKNRDIIAGSLDAAGTERVLIATIGAHGPAATGLTVSVEPEDFMLAARLRSVAKLNLPSARAPEKRAKSGRPVAPPVVKRSTAGLLPPVLARSAASAKVALPAVPRPARTQSVSLSQAA